MRPDDSIVWIESTGVDGSLGLVISAREAPSWHRSRIEMAEGQVISDHIDTSSIIPPVRTVFGIRSISSALASAFARGLR